MNEIMSVFVERPNLPSGKISRIIAGKLPDEVRNELINNNIEILEISDNPLLGKLSSHADLQVAHLGGNKLLLSKKQSELGTKLMAYGFDVDYFEIKNGYYPYDCAVNAAFVGDNVICRQDILEEKLKKYIIGNNYKIINVNQGYSKCSVCVVDDNSIITEDESIKNACEMSGIDVLLIKKGFVKLDGFDYGFIGGASFKLDNKTLAFIGKIENHPDFQSVKDFLNKKEIVYISLGNTVLTDIGSVIPLNE